MHELATSLKPRQTIIVDLPFLSLGNSSGIESFHLFLRPRSQEIFLFNYCPFHDTHGETDFYSGINMDSDSANVHQADIVQ